MHPILITLLVAYYVLGIGLGFYLDLNKLGKGWATLGDIVENLTIFGAIGPVLLLGLVLNYVVEAVAHNWNKPLFRTKRIQHWEG